jgi:hypothetical protein
MKSGLRPVPPPSAHNQACIVGSKAQLLPGFPRGRQRDLADRTLERLGLDRLLEPPDAGVREEAARRRSVRANAS